MVKYYTEKYAEGREVAVLIARPGLPSHDVFEVMPGCFPGFVAVHADCTGITTLVPTEAVPALIEALTAVHGKLTEGE